MSLEQKTTKEKITRRQFLQTTLKALITTGGTTLLWKCKNTIIGPEPPTTHYNITITNLDIFTEQEIGGTVILNGTTQPSGTTFQVPNGEINTIDVITPGYIQAYGSGPVVKTELAL